MPVPQASQLGYISTTTPNPESPFNSPSRFTISSPKSPFRSPGKRGVIKLEISSNDRIVFSPVKTPNGRAGSPSPRKRAANANRSARKRALKSTSVYSKLMNEDENSDEEDDYLRNQDIRIAESILRQSRDEEFKGYGSDVEFEEDISEKKTRGRKKKEDLKVHSDPEISSEDLEEEESEEEPLDSSDEEVVFGKKNGIKVSGTPRTRKRASASVDRIPEKSPFLDDSDNTATPSGSPTKRKRVGRPTKAEKVIGSIKSIFQQDDETFFRDNKSPNGERKHMNIKVEDDKNGILSKLEDAEVTPPVISGIPTTEQMNDNKDNTKEFVPLAIPKTDQDGNISDQDFLQEHFGGVPIQENLKGRFLDDRAFFLEGSEGYFEQHSTRAKPSNNSLAQLAPTVEYSAFIPYIKLSDQIASKEKEYLRDVQKSLYPQYCYELSQGFNLIFYGVGSKIEPIFDFVKNYFIDWFEDSYEGEIPEIMVVNGYNPTIKFKRVLQDIVTSFIPPEDKKKERIRFPKHLVETIPFLINYIEKHRTIEPDGSIAPKLILVINNIDGEGFRDEKIQNYLSQLCALPEIWAITSSDNVNCTLLWDSFKSKNFNFIWHDLTTYQSYSTEMSFKDVLNLGKSKKFIGDKGTRFVLSSLTSNYKKLYKKLLEKQLEIMKNASNKPSRNGLKGSIRFGLKFDALFKICVEEFITSHEISFRTMLGEFVEHKMCNLVKDDSGAEIVFVPNNFDEMEKLLSDEF